MTIQNRTAAIVLGLVAAGAAGFMWWASTTGPDQSAAPTPGSTSPAAPSAEAPATRPESASLVPELASTIQIPSRTAVLVPDEPVIATQTGSAGEVAARFAAAYLTRDRDSDTWADNWGSRAAAFAGPTLQTQITTEWSQQTSRVSGTRSTAQVNGVEPLPGASSSDTEQSVVVTLTQDETVNGIETPLTSTVVLHLRLIVTDTGWIVDAILPQAN